MKKITATVLVLIALSAITFRATHHPVYGKCHTTANGFECKLIRWAGNN